MHYHAALIRQVYDKYFIFPFNLEHIPNYFHSLKGTTEDSVQETQVKFQNTNICIWSFSHLLVLKSLLNSLDFLLLEKYIWYKNLHAYTICMCFRYMNPQIKNPCLTGYRLLSRTVARQILRSEN